MEYLTVGVPAPYPSSEPQYMGPTHTHPHTHTPSPTPTPTRTHCWCCCCCCWCCCCCCCCQEKPTAKTGKRSQAATRLPKSSPECAIMPREALPKLGSEAKPGLPKSNPECAINTASNGATRSAHWEKRSQAATGLPKSSPAKTKGSFLCFC